MSNRLREVVDFSINNQLSFIEALIKLTNYEIDVREQNMIHSMVKMRAFPHRKEIDAFDFEFQPNINKQQILDFISLRFLEQQENIVFLGPSGVSKPHLAIPLGIGHSSG